MITNVGELIDELMRFRRSQKITISASDINSEHGFERYTSHEILEIFDGGGDVVMCIDVESNKDYSK